MGKLIKSFTFDRNTFLKTPELSAERCVECYELLKTGQPIDKTASNKIGAFASYMGLFEKDGDNYTPTNLYRNFYELYKENPSDSWRWLISRSFWLYQVPNGTNAKVNSVATELGAQFNFFYLILQVLSHLQSQPGINRFLYYDELCAVLNDDANWSLDSYDLFYKIIQERNDLPHPNDKVGFLEELENNYDLPRDNYNGIFNKSFEQTGLFTYSKRDNGKIIGISINDEIDGVIRERLRFILDNPVSWDTTQPWSDFLSAQPLEFPIKVSKSAAPPLIHSAPLSIKELPSHAKSVFNTAGFQIDEEVIRRFIASLMAKRFVILSGLSGSGKTKVAQLVAAFLDNQEVESTDPFEPGIEINSQSANYVIKSVSPNLIELTKPDDDVKKVVPLPRELIVEWANLIESKGFSTETSNADIRKLAEENSAYDPFMHGYASHLRAAAFHYIESNNGNRNKNSRYSIVPVEANWTSTEDIFGYADALSVDRYIKRPALDLVLRAIKNYESIDPIEPYFLVLDEMNLSHVERYFAAVLSAIESGEAIALHSEKKPIAGVPPKLTLPPNLFVIGTINIDETTYMFSPKVLDRANVVEFKVPLEQMTEFLNKPEGINIAAIEGKGHTFSTSFVENSMQPLNIITQSRQLLSEEINIFFSVLMKQEAEFGYRTAMEMARFLQFHEQLTSDDWDFRIAWDAQIHQKLLPKIHGSQRKLEPLLRALAVLCHDWRLWHNIKDDAEKKRLQDELIILAIEASDLTRRELDPLSAMIEAEKLLDLITDDSIKKLVTEYSNGNPKTEMKRFSPETSYLKLSFEKVIRMLNRLQRDGFASYAEA